MSSPISSLIAETLLQDTEQKLIKHSLENNK
jgi:hypothetical protein